MSFGPFPNDPGLASTIRYGTHANRPSATSVADGTVYFETDTGNGFQSQSGAWVQITVSTGAVAPMTLTGTSDAKQLLVKGNAVQTNSIFEIANSAGTSLFDVTNSGQALFGGDASANIYRDSAGTLRTDGALIAGNLTGAQPAGWLIARASVLAAGGLATQVQIGPAGPGGASAIWFQQGEAGSNLYRSAAGALKTDGTLEVAGLLTADAGLAVATAGRGIQIKSGANCKIGTATLVGGTVTVANTSITANSIVLITDQSAGAANIGTLAEKKSARVAGTSFEVDSTNALDTSTFGYLIVEPI